MEEFRPPHLIRFGVYEVDLRAEELRKGGVKIKLRGQPFQVLAMLLERPGEVVTREELQKKLWPSGTFVDFDHSLNTAVNKIREVLGDSAENPRFVETLARRGYRFIAPAERIGQTTAAEVTKNSSSPANEEMSFEVSTAASKPPAARELVSAEISKEAASPVSRRWRKWAAILAIAAFTESRRDHAGLTQSASKWAVK